MSRRFGRRAFLGGASVILGLPFLPSLEDRAGGVRSAAAATASPKRFLLYYVPNGVYLPAWNPTTTGPNYVASPILTPLAPVRDDVLVLGGIQNYPGVPPTTNGAHAGGSGALLTCMKYMKNNVINQVKSIDQVIADTIAPATKLKTLELGITDVPNGDGPDIISLNLSWTGPTTPAPPIVKPSVAFDRLFQGYDPTATQAEIARRNVYRTSVLDVVQKDLQGLSPRLGTTDKMRLDEYLTSVRAVETQIQTNPALGGSCKVPARPMDPMDFPSQVAINHQLISLAFQCDITRVITFMHGHGLGGRSFPFLGINDNGHTISHNGGDPVKIAQEKTIDTWRVGQFVALVQMLKALTDVDGNSVLSNTVVYYTSEISNGQTHDQHNKPILLAGQLGGAIKTGRYVEYPPGIMGQFLICNEFSKAGCNPAPAGMPPDTMAPALADLYTAFLKAFGVNQTTFGQAGTAPLDLTA